MICLEFWDLPLEKPVGGSEGLDKSSLVCGGYVNLLGSQLLFVESVDEIAFFFSQNSTAELIEMAERLRRWVTRNVCRERCGERPRKNKRQHTGKKRRMRFKTWGSWKDVGSVRSLLEKEKMGWDCFSVKRTVQDCVFCKVYVRVSSVQSREGMNEDEILAMTRETGFLIFKELSFAGSVQENVL